MKTARKTMSPRQLVAIGLSVLVLAVIITAVTLLDSPAQERIRRLDERRVSDLRELSYAVDAYWTREGALPASLEELSQEERIVGELLDPETGQPYEYRVVGENTYELCAEFALDTTIDDRDYPYRSSWFHDPGRECFELEVQDVNRATDR